MMTEAKRDLRNKNIAYALSWYSKETGKSFDIVDILGEGGCGIVFELRNKKTGEAIVLKAIDTAITEIDCTIAQMDRYAKEEIRSLKIGRGHKNIIQLLDAYYCSINEKTGEMVYLMFLPKLEPVTKYFMKSAHDPKSILAMTTDICNALTFCHQNGILHRDVKPGNMYYSYDEKCFVLADFGVARSAFDPKRAVTAIGTYIAPEIRAGKPLQDRYNSDIYSLGMTTLVLLASFNANCSQEEYLQNMKPEELKVVISKAMAPDPALRYQTADELSADIKSIEWRKKEPVYSADVAECVNILVSGKQSKAKEIAENGHKNGNIRMTCVLAYILSTEGKAKEALAMLDKIKSTNDRVVLGLYGIIGCTYFGGSEKYKKYILQSADKGFCLAQYFIGRWYSDGQNGFREDFNKGFDYVYRSAKQGFTPAVRYMRKALKRHRVHDSDAMIDLLDAEIKGYNHDKDFPIYCVQAIAIG